MKVNVQAVNFNAQTSLSEFVDKKLTKIDKIYDKIVGVNISFKLENSSEKNNKTTEILVEIPGDDIVVKKTGQTFEESLDVALDTVKKLIIRHKEKHTLN